MHETLDMLYAADCGHDHTELATGDNSLAKLITQVKAAFEKAAEYIHGQKKYRPSMLRDPEIKAVITTTNKALQSAISKNIGHEVPAKMRQALQQNVFYFSGMKTHAEMAELSGKLLDGDGNIRPLAKFQEDAKKLNDTYNDNYLRAERNFAVKSSQTAAKWGKYEQGKDRYDLRYLTDNGPNVRDSHRALEFTTLPVDDPVWDKYTPPNGYNCHCFLVQVRKGEYPVSDSDEARAKGDAATTQVGKDGTNRAEIFRFNPGKEMKVMPPNHPYTSGDCGNLAAVWHTLSAMQKVQLAGQADKCRAKKVVEEMGKSSRQAKRAEYVKAMAPLLKKSVTRYVGNDRHIKITFSRKGNLHIADDVINSINNITKKELAMLNNRLKKADYIRSSGLYKKRKDDIQRFYYFRDESKGIYYHVAEAAEKRGNGKINMKRFLYSISNEMPEK